MLKTLTSKSQMHKSNASSSWLRTCNSNILSFSSKMKLLPALTVLIKSLLQNVCSNLKSSASNCKSKTRLLSRLKTRTNRLQASVSWRKSKKSSCSNSKIRSLTLFRRTSMISTSDTPPKHQISSKRQTRGSLNLNSRTMRTAPSSRPFVKSNSTSIRSTQLKSQSSNSRQQIRPTMKEHSKSSNSC